MITEVRVQELCKSLGGRPGLSVLMSLTVSVEVKQRWTMLRHWSQFVPNISTDIRGHEALHHHHLTEVWLGSQNSQNSQAAAVLHVLSFSVALRPQRPHGLLETEPRTATSTFTAPEFCGYMFWLFPIKSLREIILKLWLEFEREGRVCLWGMLHVVSVIDNSMEEFSTLNCIVIDYGRQWPSVKETSPPLAMTQVILKT